MDTEAPETPYRRSWFRFFAWVALYVVIFFAVILTTLSALGGKSETLKAGVEQFFTRASGHPAHVETLEGLHFFPDFRMDIAGLDILDKEEEGEPVIHLESLKMAMGFWDMIGRTGRIEALDLEGLRFAPGFVHSREITVERLAILHPAGEGSRLEGMGTIGDVSWFIRFDLQSIGVPPRLSYRFGAERHFLARLGPWEVEGMLADGEGHLAIEGFTLKDSGRAVLRGHPLLRADAEQVLHIGGELELAGQDGSWRKLSPDLTLTYKEGALAFGGRMTASADSLAIFESLRQTLQNLAGYPDMIEGKPGLLMFPLVTEVSGTMNKAAE